MTQITRFLLFIFLLSGLVVGVGGAAGGQAAADTPSANAGWEEMGVGSASGAGINQSDGVAQYPTLAIGPDGPIIAWADSSSNGIGIYVRRWDDSAWVEMGVGSATGDGISDGDKYVINPELVIGSSGPIVVWQDDRDGDPEIYIRRWDGAAWVEMGQGSTSGGGISDNSGGSHGAALVSGPDGPIVAWYDDSSGDHEIYVRRWNGAAWQEMGAGSASGGGISNNDGSSVIPALALGPEGPTITWYDDSSGDYEIYVRRWDGTAWVEMGAGSASGGGISDNSGGSHTPTLVSGPNGPVIAWNDDSSGSEIYVRRWDGAAWVEMGAGSASGGGISNNNGWSESPTLAVGPQGVIIAWEDSSAGDREIYVKRWDGSAWVEVGAGSASGGGISDNDAQSENPKLAIGPDRAIVTWNDDSVSFWETKIYVRQSPIFCYALTLNHTGQGSNPTANPPNSDGCAVGQFTAGQAISVIAAPDPGWWVAGWSGTADDNSQGTINTLTMLAATHTVSVFYYPIPPPTDWVFTPLLLHQPPPPCQAGPNEQEPNNMQSQANGPLCHGQTYTGLPTDRFDIFYFDLGQTADVAATLDNHAGNGVQLALHHEAITANPLDVDFTVADGFRVGAANAAPGRYFVVIYAETPGPATPYTLQAEWE